MKNPQSAVSSVSTGRTKAEIIEILERFFKEMEEVSLVFLFGSMATGRSRKKSDVDIAILFKSPPRIDHSNDIRSMEDKLSALLRKEVDLVHLDHASPILKMQVLKNGVLVYASDKKHFYQFHVDTLNQYDDLKMVRKECEKSILKGRLYA
jgi:predicted nucleotidyltransferase